MDRDFRASFQKALLDNTEQIAKSNELMLKVETRLAVWDEIIGKDEDKGMRKMLCQHEKDIRGKDKDPGLWTVTTRLSVITGAIITVGGSIAVLFFVEHPDALGKFIASFTP